MMLTRVVKMHFNPVFVEEFKILFKTLQPRIQSCQGCLTVTLLQDSENEEIFFTISQWENEDYLEAYRRSDFFYMTWSVVKPNFAQKAEAWSLLEQ